VADSVRPSTAPQLEITQVFSKEIDQIVASIDCDGKIVVLTTHREYSAAQLKRDAILRNEMAVAPYSIAIPYVYGDVDSAISSVCDKKVTTLGLDKLAELQQLLVGESKWTVIFAPKTSVQDHASVLKRSAPRQSVPPQYNQSYADRPVSDKYIFFNTGMFNAITAMIPVALVLWMAIVWINKLQTPARFEKKRDGQQFQIVPKHA